MYATLSGPRIMVHLSLLTRVQHTALSFTRMLGQSAGFVALGGLTGRRVGRVSRGALPASHRDRVGEFFGPLPEALATPSGRPNDPSAAGCAGGSPLASRQSWAIVVPGRDFATVTCRIRTCSQT